MQKLIAALIAGAFALTSVAAIAADTAKKDDTKKDAKKDEMKKDAKK
ncbi:MAG: hypothetical protein ACREUW_09285 [Burkholderiales bacterium]